MTDMSNVKTIILIIENDAQIRRFVHAALSSNSYEVVEAATANEGLQRVGAEHPDLILLDLGLPDMEGIELTRQLRQWSSIPILIISARTRETDKVIGLDAGADDYLTKPFGAEELMARIRVALRHSKQVKGEEEPVFAVGGLRVDRNFRKVYVNEAEIHLSPIEFNLLSVLMRFAGKVVTRDHLLREVWGASCIQEGRYLRVYMAHLRRKLEADPARPAYLLTEPGVGYRLTADFGDRVN